MEGAVEVGRGKKGDGLEGWRCGRAGSVVHADHADTGRSHPSSSRPDTRWQVQMQVPPSPLPFGAGVGWVLGGTCLH